jgi:RHS repeat-associated protein
MSTEMRATKRAASHGRFALCLSSLTLVAVVLAAGAGAARVSLAGAHRAQTTSGALASSIPPPGSAGWQLNGSAKVLSDGSLQLTDGVVASGASAFFKTPVNAETITISFDVTMTGSGGGSHADGVTVDLIDATTQSPTALGGGGGGLGFTGLSGIGVSFDDYYNYECDPSSNFVAVINGSSCGNSVVAHLATSTSIPQLWGNTTHATVTFTRASTSTVKLWVNGTLTLNTNVSNIPASAYLGFTGSNGGYWQREVITNVTTDLAVATQPPEQTYGTCGGSGAHALAPSVCTADPVNSLTGAFTSSESDLSLPAPGLPFEFERSYTSADSTSGRLGQGWTDSYSASLAIQSNGDVFLHGEDGQRVTYTKQTDGSFVGAAGASSVLTAVIGGYQLVRNDQVTYLFDAQGRLMSMRDRNGQGVTLAYDSGGHLATITDTVGHVVTVTSNADGTLSKVAVPDGRSVSYGYTNGLLSSVTDPLGKKTTFGYDPGDRLVSEVDPNNHTVFSNVYGTDGRVTRQTDASGQTTTFAWDPATQTQTVTDPRGNVWKDVYFANVLVERIDPQQHVTKFDHAMTLDTTSIAAPDGQTTTMTYDARGNVLTATAPASLGSVQKIFTYDGRNNVTKVTDGRGKVTNYGYDAAGNNTSVLQDGVTVAQSAYNSLGEQVSFTDGNGKTTSYGYDASGNVITETDPLGKKSTYTYDAAGRFLTSTDSLNHKTTFTYDANGNQLTETDPLGKKTTYSYDASGNQTSVTDANNHKTTSTYDAANRLASVKAPDGGVTTYDYDAAGNQAGVTDPTNHVTTYAYDAANRLASITTPKSEQTTYVYDANGNLSNETDPLGHATTYTYDAAGRLLTETDALGKATTYGYDAVGNLTSVADANGHTTTYAFDAQNRLAAVTAPDAGVTSYGYDGAGNQTSVTDSLGHKTTSVYDAAGRLVSTTTPLGNVAINTYDAAGNLTKVTNPLGKATSYAYDADGQLVKETDPLGKATSFTYDVAGNRLSMTDANNRKTTYGYDTAGRLLSVTAPDGGVTSYTYDTAGNRLTRADANGHVTTYTYDQDNRVASTIAPLGRTWTYEYDAAGNPRTLVDANGNATPTTGDGTTTYSYDADNRPTAIGYSDSTPAVSFAYDAVGNRSSMTDGAGTVSYVHDSADRLTRATRGTDTFAYTYDTAGDITSRTYPDGTAANYAYDLDSRLASVTSAGQTTKYGYDKAGNVVSTTLPSGNGYVETRTYDADGRALDVKNAKGATVLSEFAYTLDAVGNPTKVVRTGSLPSTTVYTYDAANRLTSVCFQSTCSSTSPLIRWTYDKVGNRLTETRPSGITSYAYNAADELTQAGTTSYGYDQNGNEISAGARTLSYDVASRLSSTTSGGATATYGYDGDGNRLQATSGGETTNYLWDTSSSLPQLALERTGTGTLARRYLYGLARISMTTPAESLYYHYDSLGAVANVISSAGATDWTYAYEPFGSTRSETKNDPNAPDNPMKFDAELADPTGLYYLRARQYDPTSGRFTSLDPVPASPSDPYSSSYAYTADRPTVMVDPSGETIQPANTGQDAVRFVASAASADGPDCAKIDPNDRCLPVRPRPAHKRWALPFRLSSPFKGIDQGVDYATSEPAKAITSGLVYFHSDYTHWEGNGALYEHFDHSVAIHGRPYYSVYYAEERPLILQHEFNHTHKRVTVGQPIMKAGPSYPYTELGFAAGQWGTHPAAWPYNPPPGRPWTLEGQDFYDFLHCVDHYVHGKKIPGWCHL